MAVVGFVKGYSVNREGGIVTTEIVPDADLAHELAFEFIASANDVLASLGGVGVVTVRLEGFGGTGGGGGGQGGNIGVAAAGASGGGAGGCIYQSASFDFDLSHRLDIHIGAGGARGAGGAAGGADGSDGADGAVSYALDFTEGVVIASLAGSSGGKASAGGAAGEAGASYPGAALSSSAGFLAAGGVGALPGAAGSPGQRSTVSLEVTHASHAWAAGLGGASGVNRGGGGGGGGAGALGDGGAGGDGNAGGAAGGSGADAPLNSGAGAGGGAGGALVGDAGGPGGVGALGFVRLSVLVGGTMRAAFSPTDIPGLALWLRSDLGVTLVSGHVSQWADQSGAGDANRNVSQATSSKRPLFVASDAAYNHQPSLAFTKALSQFLRSGVWSSPNAQPFTLFIVGNDDGANNEAYADGLALNTQAVTILFNEYCARAGVVLTNSVAPTGAPLVLACFFDGVSSSIATSSYTPHVGDAGATNGTGLTLGIGGDQATNPLGGKIVEVVGVHGAVSREDTIALMTYFSQRYAIAIAP